MLKIVLQVTENKEELKVSTSWQLAHQLSFLSSYEPRQPFQ
jgi:hypothetical protein